VSAALGAGTLAGMLGIGGGMVLVPLVVALNFDASAVRPLVWCCWSHWMSNIPRIGETIWMAPTRSLHANTRKCVAISPTYAL
jgi:uncharacterized membrane protein YfcA